MSNEELNKYNELYSQLVSHFVEMHNYHHAFIEWPSIRNGKAARKTINEMVAVATQLRRLSATVSKEHEKNIVEGHKAAKKAKAEQKRFPGWRANPKPKGLRK
jgi:wyosine [tRNA(Phe)-imidazoG37] synthetase (radical SAM superfamily)